MLKTSRKPLLVVVLLLCIAGGSLTAYGYFFTESNVAHVDMQYAVALTVSVVDSNVTLYAAVTNNGSPVRAGLNVDFYCSYNNGDWAWFASRPTDATGTAQATFTTGSNGGYDFKATVTVP